MDVKKNKVHSPNEDTYSYKGWLNSDSFLKRAFAIVGHQTVAVLIIYGVLIAVFIVILVLIGLASLA